MKVFVYEYITAGGVGPGTPPSLEREGLAMLHAAAHDFNQVPGLEVLCLVSSSIEAGMLPGEVWKVDSGRELGAFMGAVDAADAVLVIAPEFDGLLEECSCRVLEKGKRLLGSRPEGIRLCADKLELCHTLERQGIPAAKGSLLDPSNGLPGPVRFPCVVKPVDGAGCLNTFLLQNIDEYNSVMTPATRREFKGRALLQPFYPGVPASVSFLVHERRAVSLLPGRQRLAEGHSFRYLGGRLPLEEELAPRAVKLAKDAVEAVPGLQGYAGVDLVLGVQGEDVVMEINPRLTTSYVGLRALSRTNLMGSLLRLLEEEEVPSLSWQDGTVSFLPDGTILQHE